MNRIVGTYNEGVRLGLVFEDGTFGVVVGLKPKDAPDGKGESSPVILVREALPLLTGIPDDARLAAVRPKLFPGVTPGFTTEPKGKFSDE